jgi:hypothetical protein
VKIFTRKKSPSRRARPRPVRPRWPRVRRGLWLVLAGYLALLVLGVPGLLWRAGEGGDLPLDVLPAAGGGGHQQGGVPAEVVPDGQGGLVAVQPRHANVQQEHVGPGRQGQPQRRPAVVGHQGSCPQQRSS